MKCPICSKPTQFKDNPARPFCSERCKLIDFGNWADENYCVPAEDAASSVDLADEDIEQHELPINSEQQSTHVN